MMKKQLNRMRLRANQTMFRTEKTEVLSDELLKVEKRLESLKMVFHHAHKKLSACLHGTPGLDLDKRLKRVPVAVLAVGLSDSYRTLEDMPFGKVLQQCGEAQLNLAMEVCNMECSVETNVLEPINLLAEEHIPNIQKQRKHLSKMVLDMEGAKSRYQQASKVLQGNVGAMTPSKLEALREEMEEEENKVEIMKDQYATELYQFVAKEKGFADYFVKLLETQAEFHKRSLAVIETLLPKITAEREHCVRPCYGQPLEEHLHLNRRDIAFPIEACVVALMDSGLQEEGLFRIAAANSKLKKLKASLDCCIVESDFSPDPHAIAGALKSYIRELPEPLMTFHLFTDWSKAFSMPDQQERLQALWSVCDLLPKENKANFRYLMKFLARLAEQQEFNKMTPSNIAIVLGPNLLWAPTSSSVDAMSSVSIQVVGIVEMMLQYSEWFFPDEVEFDQTGIFAAASQLPAEGPGGAPAGGPGGGQLLAPGVNGERRGGGGAEGSRARPLSVATDNDLARELHKKDGATRHKERGSFYRAATTVRMQNHVVGVMGGAGGGGGEGGAALSCPNTPSLYTAPGSPLPPAVVVDKSALKLPQVSPTFGRKSGQGSVNPQHKAKKPAPAPPKAVASLVQGTQAGVSEMGSAPGGSETGGPPDDTPPGTPPRAGTHSRSASQSSVLSSSSSPSPSASLRNAAAAPAPDAGGGAPHGASAAATASGKPPVPKPRARPAMPPPPQPPPGGGGGHVGETAQTDSSDDGLEEMSTGPATEPPPLPTSDPPAEEDESTAL
ncbi:rho GTPase-activating protein 44-like isoform X1 [Lethenteron reissneri]|uniref:rho GTPase-activating protein 44-like isoform X1 n=1 Tax=Lethenteron reissneri TaxID=7753 RepID=UPI002AB762B1|nr:rho GTPase-activating protein 44-like isoform X1 [Lethenteron reissneri]